MACLAPTRGKRHLVAQHPSARSSTRDPTVVVKKSTNEAVGIENETGDGMEEKQGALLFVVPGTDEGIHDEVPNSDDVADLGCWSRSIQMISMNGRIQQEIQSERDLPRQDIRLSAAHLCDLYLNEVVHHACKAVCQLRREDENLSFALFRVASLYQRLEPLTERPYLETEKNRRKDGARVTEGVHRDLFHCLK